MKTPFLSAVLVLLSLVVSGGALLLFLLLAMNGYSESDAQWGLAGFLFLAFVVAAGVAAASFFLTRKLLFRGYGILTAVTFATCAAVVLGVLLQSVSALVGILIAECIRTNF